MTNGIDYERLMMHSKYSILAYVPLFFIPNAFCVHGVGKVSYQRYEAYKVLRPGFSLAPGSKYILIHCGNGVSIRNKIDGKGVRRLDVDPSLRVSMS
jgi:hypothetical protein